MMVFSAVMEMVNRNQCHFIRKWFVNYNQPRYLWVIKNNKVILQWRGLILYRKATRKILFLQFMKLL